MVTQLGERYRDTFTEFEGVAVSRTMYLYGCVRVCLEGRDNNGQPVEFFFDEQRLEAVGTGKSVETDALTGGSRQAPPRAGLRR